ncbi:hypothetical protein J2T15_004241 [Paenibacillus harenae]|uniref:Uncharacterized protein n=1 Tax=Paenibacillus harenae TaxID=306543 RepID=A0ABT9U572_PAEHA|nr:hypothetical protein [Paenibacillus harenae]
MSELMGSLFLMGFPCWGLAITGINPVNFSATGRLNEIAPFSVVNIGGRWPRR